MHRHPPERRPAPADAAQNLSPALQAEALAVQGFRNGDRALLHTLLQTEPERALAAIEKDLRENGAPDFRTIRGAAHEIVDTHREFASLREVPSRKKAQVIFNGALSLTAAVFELEPDKVTALTRPLKQIQKQLLSQVERQVHTRRNTNRFDRQNLASVTGAIFGYEEGGAAPLLLFQDQHFLHLAEGRPFLRGVEEQFREDQLARASDRDLAALLTACSRAQTTIAGLNEAVDARVLNRESHLELAAPLLEYAAQTGEPFSSLPTLLQDTGWEENMDFFEASRAARDTTILHARGAAEPELLQDLMRRLVLDSDLPDHSARGAVARNWSRALALAAVSFGAQLSRPQQNFLKTHLDAGALSHEQVTRSERKVYGLLKAQKIRFDLDPHICGYQYDFLAFPDNKPVLIEVGSPHIHSTTDHEGNRAALGKDLMKEHLADQLGIPVLEITSRELKGMEAAEFERLLKERSQAGGRSNSKPQIGSDLAFLLLR